MYVLCFSVMYFDPEMHHLRIKKVVFLKQLQKTRPFEDTNKALRPCDHTAFLFVCKFLVLQQGTIAG